ncbi:VOC family protein [Octadecabacter sp. G9-8]|uniref:VOC family protein n=1 Tax=Octadecabacter dasysiphoniae TaxID=2909341 RepID=A0ABS9CY68_9RHOB|nr:VOC family protein [Octadecabacter dasysiphoniae]
MPRLTSLDHIVLTVASIEATTQFYGTVLGMIVETFTPFDGTCRTALKFGVQKINLHRAGAEFEPKARTATPGSADLCFLSDTSLNDWTKHLAAQNIDIEDGPIARTGATGPIHSIYIRDPDGNLIEIANLT